MKRYKNLFFLFLIIGFQQFLFCQDSTNYYLTRNIWSVTIGGIYSDTVEFEKSNETENNFPSKLDHYFYKFDSTKMELNSWAALTKPDSVLVTGSCKWRLSNDKKKIILSDLNAGEVTYFIAKLDEKRILLIRKKQQ